MASQTTLTIDQLRRAAISQRIAVVADATADQIVAALHAAGPYSLRNAERDQRLRDEYDARPVAPRAPRACSNCGARVRTFDGGTGLGHECGCADEC